MILAAPCGPIDAAAHRASLQTATIAVLAGGHDCIYPAEHVELVEALVVDGAAISERLLGWEPRAHDFPRRNRLISGLSIGVIIVEAARRSGSGWPENRAARSLRCPAPLDPRCEGTNGLLKQGAIPVTEASDVIAAIEPILRRGIQVAEVREPAQDALQKNAEPGADDRNRIVSLLGPTPVSIDDLVRLVQTTPAIVRAALLELEIGGRIERHGAGLVSLL